MSSFVFILSWSAGEFSLMQAIDEAESKWCQHNAKKLIDTGINSLQGSIPKTFPYFHVEVGMQKGFVHVIDDENNFKIKSIWSQCG